MQTLTGLSALIERVKVLASSALTWLTALLAVLVVLSQELGKFAGVPAGVTQVLASAIAVLTVAVFQVRRVTPVDATDKGLLPPKGPAVPAGDVAKDVGEVSIPTLLLVVAFVCLVIFTLIAHGTFVSDEGFTWLGAGLSAWVLAGLVR